MSKRTLPVRVQTVIIKKTLAKSSRQAASIARTHGAKTTKVDETGQSYRFRQHPPGNYLPGSFRAFVLNKHVTLVYGTPKGRGKALEKIAGILAKWPRREGVKFHNPPNEDEDLDDDEDDDEDLDDELARELVEEDELMNASSAEDYYNLSKAGRPHMVSKDEAREEIRNHEGASWREFLNEVGDKEEYDAWKVLEWLGH